MVALDPRTCPFISDPPIKVDSSEKFEAVATRFTGCGYSVITFARGRHDERGFMGCARNLCISRAVSCKFDSGCARDRGISREVSCKFDSGRARDRGISHDVSCKFDSGCARDMGISHGEFLLVWARDKGI